MKKRVLLLCMLDSIHTANWIERFKDSNVNIAIYPSKKFRKLHPKIVHIVKNSSNVNIINRRRLIPVIFYGYLDFFLNALLPKFKVRSNRLSRLQSYVDSSNLDFVHALEIQGAGYLSARLSLKSNTKLIVTNWGSDIFFFKNIETDLIQIRNILQKADRYSAECRRDYNLARNLGFTGVELPVIPNSGGNIDFGDQLSYSKEFLIAAKCYGGQFGRGDITITAVWNLFKIDNKFKVHFYSVSPELEHKINELKNAFPHRVQYSTIRSGMSHEEMINLFKRARIYIGCSLSDGISTSFLEALSFGVYPIQTNTSCANEWVEKGVYASLVSLDVDEISSELVRKALDWQDLEELTHHNFDLAKKYLNPENIKAQSQVFYDL